MKLKIEIKLEKENLEKEDFPEIKAIIKHDFARRGLDIEEVNIKEDGRN